MEKRSVKISPVPTRTRWTTGETVELLIGPKEDQGKYVITDVTADHITLEAANQQPAGHTMTGTCCGKCGDLSHPGKPCYERPATRPKDLYLS